MPLSRLESSIAVHSAERGPLSASAYTVKQRDTVVTAFRTASAMSKRERKPSEAGLVAVGSAAARADAADASGR